MDDMYTPIFHNVIHDIRFVFPRLYVPTEDYAMEVGRTVKEAAKNANFVDVEFTGEVANLKDLAEDTRNMRIIAPFNNETGDQDYILILDSAGETPEYLKEQ